MFDEPGVEDLVDPGNEGSPGPHELTHIKNVQDVRRMLDGVRFDTKLAVVVCDELPVWQKLNMTAFLSSGVAATQPDSIGQPYEDGDGSRYLPMFAEPVVVLAGDRRAVRRGFDRARDRGLQVSVFTAELFSTGHDEANREAVRAVASADLDVVGFALRGERKAVDKALDGLRLHP